MSNEREIIRKTEKMIDELKSVCNTYGLGNASSEYKIITELFLYKYLNDKFLYETKRVAKELNDNSSTKEIEQYLDSLSPTEFSKLVMRMNPNVARIKNEYRISYLFQNQNSTMPEFYELFDNALVGISNDNLDIFSVKTGSKEKIKLFDTLSQYITESDKKNLFFRAMINKLVDFSFESAFEEKYDFFATVFEYLIKDYNKDFGKYAEYYTPNSIARIIARILAPNPTQNISLYDPSAGSGTLLLALAHQIGEDNCTIYSQDISQKSNEFLRLNLILNNLVHSLPNIIHGDTLLNPAHYNSDMTRLQQFDYIVSNPPFKTDFSETRDQLDTEKFRDRFFAGVPNVPKKDKEKMAIYLLFIQHILYSLKDNGKAAIVVPTGFLSSSTGIEKNIKEYILREKMLEGVISMPSNIFANTGTNVSIILLNNNHQNNQALFIDATNLGEKIKDGKNQRTILLQEDMNKITEYYVEKKEENKFSVMVDYKKIIQKKYSLSAGPYFDIEIDHINISSDEFNNYVADSKKELFNLVSLNKKLTEEIFSSLEELIYDEKN